MTGFAAPVTLATLRNLKRNGRKFACLTAYDASYARLCEDAEVEVVLVGDSLGMVIQGHDSTLPVTLNDMIYHTANVHRAVRNSLIMADMPFMTYVRAEQAVFSAGRLMKEGGAHMVKLEGGAAFVETVRAMATNGIPVCAHLGLLPQSVNKLGGYRVQGKDETSATAMLNDARAMQDAGADMVLLECVPATLGAQITKALEIPVVGIGAGVDCDAQVLVIYDMLGITPGKRPKFSHDFLQGRSSVRDAIDAYASAVKSGAFPGPEHSF